MKTLQKILGVGVAVALLGVSVVMADGMRPNSAKEPLRFQLDIGDSSVNLPDISFDALGSTDTDEAQGTCAMTPGGRASNLMLALPPITVSSPEQLTNAPRAALAPLGSFSPPRTDFRPQRSRRPWTPQRQIPPPPIILVPEPATLLIVGLGIGAVAIVRQRGRKPLDAI